jgi:hypothetical protein
MTLRSARAQSNAPAGFVRPGFVFWCACLVGMTIAAGAGHAAGKKGEVGVGVHFGGGTYDNTDFNADLERVGYGRIDGGIEYGASVDYRLSRWFSLTGSATRIGGEAEPPGGPADPNTVATFAVRGSPLVFGVAVHPLKAKHANFDLFAGAGPLLNATVSLSSASLELEGKRTGVYWHGGVMAEYRFSPMVALTLTGLARHAEAKDVDLTEETGDPTAVWDLTFNGTAVWFGPRLYFGNTE